MLKRNPWASCWLPGTHAGTIANNNIISHNICDVLYSVLPCISGLCTAAMERQELHEDNTFTLNSEIR